jgi:FHS family L-fucose permease-like MFS transporter
VGIQHAFVIPMLCYLYIAFYGFVGSKIPKDFAV